MIERGQVLSICFNRGQMEGMVRDARPYEQYDETKWLRAPRPSFVAQVREQAERTEPFWLKFARRKR